ncbi:MAG TPA: hypothetical protein VFK32_01750 [Tepidiformaceae bacterium]|nr:hypothetical protein [Tepidiformaceae bacterium]
MSLRRSLLLVLVLAVFGAILPSSPRPASATGLFLGQNIASHTFYTLDPTKASVSVRMEATVGVADGLEQLATVSLLTMPGAENVIVRQDGTPLILPEVIQAPEPYANLKVVKATLLKPLKGALTADIVMTYTVPQMSDGEFFIASGVIETPFVSQGPGSFVSVDMPESGDNYIDPGCLVGADQPSAVASSGFKRWVCGETILLAIYAEEPAVLERCARLDNSCRQQSEQPLIAHAQSVTDPGLLSTLEQDLSLAGDRTVKMSLRYFRGDTAWAEAQFETARAAFPRLEALFGFPYPHEAVVLRQSNYIGFIGAAGVAFSSIGEVLVTNSGDLAFDKEVTIHELAHQWAGRQLETSWLWEGQAEWATHIVAPELGVSLRGDFAAWASLGYDDPLATWYNGSSVFDGYYWYGKSGAFWEAYDSAVGGRSVMTQVLAHVDDDPDAWPLDGRWFQDMGERVSGVNLDSLFLTWVYDPDAAGATMKERRTAWDARAALISEATSRGLEGEPPAIRPNLDTWNFRPALTDIEAARALLVAYDQVLADATAAGLGASTGFHEAWATAASVRDLRRELDNQKNAVQAIGDSAEALASEAAGSPSLARLDEARTAYTEGRFVDASSLASQAVSDSVNLDSAGKMLAAADERKAAFTSNFITSIGLFGADPDGDLAKAHQAYDEGRGTDALILATGAYDTWGNAQRNGMFRLAVLTGVACALLVLIAYTIGKRNAKKHHNFVREELVANRPSWRDLENSK